MVNNLEILLEAAADVGADDRIIEKPLRKLEGVVSVLLAARTPYASLLTAHIFLSSLSATVVWLRARHERFDSHETERSHRLVILFVKKEPKTATERSQSESKACAWGLGIRVWIQDGCETGWVVV